MNARTRKEIEGIIDDLNDLRERIVTIQDDEQEKYDNLTEGLQCSQMGQSLQEAVDNMDSVLDRIDDAVSYLECII